jgi:hypothetical protein
MRIEDPVPAIAFVLSSGRTLGLTIVRARNRLLQVSKLLKVDNREPEIKSLVEWVELFPPKDPRVQYVFLGYSLHTTDDFFAELPDVDSSELKALLFTEDLSDLFSELESYREDAREEHFRILEVPLKWRSRLTEWAESFTDKCHADQFCNRMLKQPGLRKDECRWHDLVRWAFYERPPKPVDPSQLGPWFQLRHIIPTLYRLVGSTAPDFGVLWRCDRELRRGERRNLPEIGDDSRVVLRHPALGFSVVHFERKDLLGTKRGWIAIDNNGEPLRTGADIVDDTIEGAVERVLSAINTRVKSWALYSDSAQWAEYTMGESDERQEHLLVLDDFPHRFETNPHYDVDNVLLHVRTSIGYSRNGLRCLVVDELQSDWLQKRADQSQKFRDGNDEFQSMPWSSDWYELGLKVVLQLAAKSQVDAVGIASSGMQKERYGNHFTEGGKKFYDNVLPNKLAKLVKPWTLPQTFQKLVFEKRPITILRTEEGCYEVLNPGGESALSVCSSLLEARKLIAMSELMCDGPEVPVFSISAELREEVVSKGLMLFG